MTEPDALDAPTLDPAAELYARQMADLRGLAEAAMGFIGSLQLKVAAGKDTGPRETAETFERYARSVRLTIAMERRLQAEEAKRLAGDPLDEQTRGALAILAARSAAAKPEPPLTKAEGRREVASKVVRDMIDYEDSEHENVEALFEYERLIEKDVSDEDLMNRPILEVVALICQELGVEPDWNLWKPEHFADPRWGLTEAELSEDAHPLGPYEPCTANWPPPGTVMPLPGMTLQPPGSPSRRSRNQT